jgi:aspartyl-tRNA(Asn)/glutamyl-tRNA(Gln) amidotransferase subunit A
MADKLLDRPIRALAAALRDGSVTAEALIEEAIACHDKRDTTLQAYKHWDPDRARREARAVDALVAAGHDGGPLMGLPLSIKDIYGVAGMPICAGTPRELPETWREEGPVVSALRRGLGIVMGKSHTVELAFGGVGATLHWPAPRNPWDGEAHRVCGGSSAGAGVSLAEPLSANFDTPGPLTRSVADAVAAFAAIDPAHDDVEALFGELEGVSAADLRLGICDEHFWDDCEAGIAEGVMAAVGELTAAGARLERLAFPEAGDARERFMSASLFGVEALSFIEEYYPERYETIDPNVGVRMEVGRRVSAVDYVTQGRKVRELAARADRRLAEVDVLVAPTVPISPPSLEEVANTQPINLLECCALTLPVALDGRGLPVGLQLIARRGRDERLLAAALACERALGTAHQRLGRPPLAPD